MNKNSNNKQSKKEQKMRKQNVVNLEQVVFEVDVAITLLLSIF